MAKCWKMHFPSYCFLFLLTFLTFLTNLKPSIQQQTKSEYAGYTCSPWRTYLKNSTYSNNLQNLLSSLSSVENDFSSGFRNLTVGENPDMVYGLYLCRGDLSPQDCFVCVSHACSDIRKQCPYGKEAWINFDHCMLRYADRNILFDPVTTTENVMQNQNLVMTNNSEHFNKVLISLVNEIVEEVAATPRKFAFKKMNYSSSQTVYALGQCMPYLTKENCSICLQRGVKSLSDNTRNKIGERFMWPSCNLRYEPKLFYNESFGQLPLSPPKLEKGTKSIEIIIEIALALAFSTLLLIACYCFRAKRAKKTYETAVVDNEGDDFKTAGSLQFDFKAVEALDKLSRSNKLDKLMRNEAIVEK